LATYDDDSSAAEISAEVEKDQRNSGAAVQPHERIEFVRA
jgi:hypothetical protein